MSASSESRWPAAAALVVLCGSLLVGCTDPELAAESEGGGGESQAGAPAGGSPTIENGGVAGEAMGPGNAGDRSEGGENGEGGAGGALTLGPPDTPYAHEVVSFTKGDNAGFNEAKLPDIVLGPPTGKGNEAGSLEVLSLGAGGEIVLGFGNRGIADEPGPDFVVFENPFWPGGDSSQVFAELGEVSVSEDGETWLTFACDPEGDGEGRFPGCAGWTPTLIYDADALIPLDAEQTGGDAFDLGELGLAHARFVKIRDLKTLPAAGTNAGFDLDAVGIIHAD
jgi:hypothetical protein